MKTLAILLCSAPALWLLPSTPPPLPQEAAAADAADLHEIHQLERDLRLARAHLAILDIQQNADLQEARFALMEARETEQAYLNYERHAERKERQLELMEMEASLADAREEREQLGMMYDANALADATAQIVLDRADRDIQQQEMALTMARESFEYWENAEIPRQQSRLQREIQTAEMALSLLEATQPVDRLDLELQVASLEEELHLAQQELAQGQSEVEDEG